MRRFLQSQLLLLATLPIPSQVVAEPPAKQRDSQQLARLIDQEVHSQLKAKDLHAADPASDAEFLRRVFLDLHGAIPALDQVEAFLNDTDPNKRARLIDALLADEQYGRNFGEIWFRALVPANQPRDDNSPPELFHAWLIKSFNANKPWDRMTYALLTATATTRKEVPDNPAVIWYMVDSTKTLEVTDATDRVSQLFLGIRMNCAQCHNHPFVDLKRRDYWGMAAFFTKITRRPGFGLFETSDDRMKVKLPESAQVVPARFLGGDEPKLDPNEPARPVLAKWVTAPDNPYFARATVNRIWAHLFGRGIVHPFDDMHEKNVPSHPELLQILTEEFVASGYDVKHLIRAICQSAAYQRSSVPHDSTLGEPQWLAHRPVRLLTPWQLYDSLARLTLMPSSAANDEKSRRKYTETRGKFIRFFNTNDETDPFAYERGIPQALQMLNATRFEGLLGEVVGSAKTPSDVIDRLYFRVLARRPAPAESARMLAHVKTATRPEDGYADVLWVLLQSSEFTTNH